MLPLIFVNYGVRTAIIEWVAMKIISSDSMKLYTPVALIDFERLLRGKRALHADNVKSHFTEFAMGSGTEKEMNILFTQEENSARYPFVPWLEGEHSFEIYVKYRDKDVPVMQKKLKIDITNQMIQDYARGTSFVNSIRDITL